MFTWRFQRSQLRFGKSPRLKETVKSLKTFKQDDPPFDHPAITEDI